MRAHTRARARARARTHARTHVHTHTSARTQGGAAQRLLRDPRAPARVPLSLPHVPYPVTSPRTGQIDPQNWSNRSPELVKSREYYATLALRPGCPVSLMTPNARRLHLPAGRPAGLRACLHVRARTRASVRLCARAQTRACACACLCVRVLVCVRVCVCLCVAGTGAARTGVPPRPLFSELVKFRESGLVKGRSRSSVGSCDEDLTIIGVLATII